jgi:hypothetical protein
MKRIAVLALVSLAACTSPTAAPGKAQAWADRVALGGFPLRQAAEVEFRIAESGCAAEFSQVRSFGRTQAVAALPLGTDQAKVDAVGQAYAAATWELPCGRTAFNGLVTSTVASTVTVTATTAAPPPTMTSTKKPTPAKPSWKCEPGYPDCTKAESDKYVSQLEFAKCQQNPEKIWDTRTQKCRYKTSGEVQSEYFGG